MIRLSRLSGPNKDRVIGSAGATPSLEGLILNPSTRVLWRGEDVVQLELGRHAVVIDGVEPSLIGRLTSARAAPESSAVAGLDAVLNTLTAAGYVWPRPSTTAPLAHPGLAGELAALRVHHGGRAEAVLAARAAACVVVHGTGRLPVAIATQLAASNVGRVTMHDTGEVHRFDAAPGGLLASDEGRRFNEAAHDAIRRAAEGVDTRAIGPSERADLIVLTGEAPLDPDLVQGLHDRAVAHLAVRIGPDDAVVGPFVLPGLSSCLTCADLTRLDRDPAWSLLAVQLTTPRRHAAPSNLALMTLAASIATMQALDYLDGDEPSTLSGSLELQLPDWQIRRRSWPLHPDCDCAAGVRRR